MAKTPIGNIVIESSIVEAAHKFAEGCDIGLSELIEKALVCFLETSDHAELGALVGTKVKCEGIEELTAGIADDNIQPEIDFGKPAGQEKRARAQANIDRLKRLMAEKKKR